MGLRKRLRTAGQFVFRARTRERLRRSWEDLWSRDDLDEPWMRRPITKQIIEAVEEGWFPAGGAALDLGCGQGEVTDWLSRHSFPTLGVDFSAAAIERARARFGEVTGLREFEVLDIVRDRLPDRRYTVVVDRGCFHAIKKVDSGRYVDNLASVCAPGARFMLFVRAFRGKSELAKSEEMKRVDRTIHDRFAKAFEVHRSEEAYLGRSSEDEGRDDMQGLVYRMSRR